MPSGILNAWFGLRKQLAEEDGQDLAEYALVASLISVAAISSLHLVATSVIALYNYITTIVSNAVLSM
jgi:Flp pilus assembly pilin Flp